MKLWLVLLLLPLYGCMQTQNSSAKDDIAYGAVAGGPEFQAVREIFSASCTGCHEYQGMSEAQLAAANLIVNAQPANSKIYNAVNGGANGVPPMPPSGSLSPADIEKIRIWIEGL